MTPREIIAQVFDKFDFSDTPSKTVAHAILIALQSHAYRLVGPGELDAETIERCVEVAAAYEDSEDIKALAGLSESQGVGDSGWLKDAMHSYGGQVAQNVARAIRALSQEATS